MSMSWLFLVALLVLNSYSWMLAGGQTCSISGTSYVASYKRTEGS